MRTLITEQARMVRADSLAPGDVIDLEGDAYADPRHDDPALTAEYTIVGAVEQETPDCLALWTHDGRCFGLPPAHLVTRLGYDPDYADT